MKTVSTITAALTTLFISITLNAQTRSFKTNEPFLRVTNGDEGILIAWTTAREVNSNYFLVETSNDSVNFTVVKQVKASGSTMFAKTYEDVENIADSGLYFRITLIDMNGNRSSSHPVSIHTPNVRAVSVR